MRKGMDWRTIFFTFLASFAFMTVQAMAADGFFNYITPDKTKAMIESGRNVTLLDIQIEEEYNRHHIRGSVPTFAYPVKSEEERARLDRVLPDLGNKSEPIVIICPRGGGGAKRTYEYLASKGIEEERMYILEEGQNGWPYSALVESK